MSTQIIRFGILGAGDIAHKFIDAVRQTEVGEVAAVASKDLQRAKAWSEREHLENYYGSYDELLADPQIDAIYIATTTNAHYENILQCLRAGRHVLCEKSLVRSYEEAQEVCALAKEKKLFLMEAMWSRFLPKTTTVRNWIAQGRIGKVNLIQATIGWKADPVYNKRLFLPELGGGALYDIGIYPLELIPYLVNQKIVDIQPLMRYHSTGVDDISSLNLRLEDCFANIQCSFTTKLPEDVYIYGEEGYIRIPKIHYGNSAFLYDHGDEIIDSFQGGGENGFIYQVEEVIHCIKNGQTESAVCPHKMTLDAAKWIDIIHRNFQNTHHHPSSDVQRQVFR